MNARTLRSIEALSARALIPRDRIEALSGVALRYAVAVTPAMADLIDAGDPRDPIALQFIPDERELDTLPKESGDPIGDDRHSPVEGIVHRYRNRVLLKIVHICPVYCRFCFRREMVGPDRESNLSPDAITGAIDYIAGHNEIAEVIFTGGDPFILTARRVSELTQRCAAIPHVKLLRWHTRVPVVDPARVTPEFITALQATPKATTVALHVNHPREFTAAARQAIARLVDAGIPMLSQSVLLKGINDDVATLAELMNCFVESRIKPYYLHHADLAPGTSHFRTTIADGQRLMWELRARVSAPALPTYVLDMPGGYAKVNLESDAIERSSDGAIRVRDDEGVWHAYGPE